MHICRGQRTKPTAFTLVELLVVIGIIAVLISILLPSLSRARKSALALQCMSNMRQLGQFTTMYQNDYNGAFPASLFYKNQAAGLPYRAEIWDCKLAPYLGVTLTTDPNQADPTAVTDQTPPSSILQCPMDTRGTFTTAGGTLWGDRLRSYSANQTVARVNAAGSPINAGRENDGVVWCSQLGYTGNIKINMVKRPAETCYLFEYWALLQPQLTDGNRQWRINYAGTDGWMGLGAIPTNAVNGFFYHDQKMGVLWCDGHVTMEDPREAYTPSALGKRSWWSRAEW